MRKTLLTALSIPLLCAASAHAAVTADEIAGMEKQWAADVTGLDIEAIERTYSDQLIYAHSNGIIDSKEVYLAKLGSGSQRYDAIEHQKMTIRVFGDSAVAHSIVRMRGANKEGPFDNLLMMIHFWVRQDGAWRLAAHQTTELPDDTGLRDPGN